MKDASELLKIVMDEHIHGDHKNHLLIDDAEGQQEGIHGYPTDVMPLWLCSRFPNEMLNLIMQGIRWWA